jgi:hypothetical protein
MKHGNRTTLESIPRKTIDVEFPELDEVYRLRQMSGTERDIFEVAQYKEQADGKIKVESMHLRARLVALCLVDFETGARQYADDEVHQLNDKVIAPVIDRLFEEAKKLSGISAFAVEDAAKNSESIPPAASTSA